VKFRNQGRCVQLLVGSESLDNRHMGPGQGRRAKGEKEEEDTIYKEGVQDST
jgi:hypothetical protein